MNKYLFGVMFLTLMATVAMAVDTNTTVTINNAAPTVGTLSIYPDDDIGTAGVQVNPIQNSNKLVTANATVTDINGYADVSSCSGDVYWSNGTNKQTGITGALTGGSGNTVLCTIDFNMTYYDIYDNYTVNITATDAAAATGMNYSTFEYQELIAIAYTAGAPVTFGSLAVGTANSTATNAPLTVADQGNVALNLSWSGTDLVNASYSIPVANVIAANQSSLSGAEYIVLAGGPQTLGTNIAVLGTYDSYDFISIPTGTAPLLYTGTIVTAAIKA